MRRWEHTRGNDIRVGDWILWRGEWLAIYQITPDNGIQLSDLSWYCRTELDQCGESEIVTALARDLEADAANAPTDLSRLAWQMGLEGRIKKVVDELRDFSEWSAEKSHGYVTDATQHLSAFTDGESNAYRHAANMLERALAGDGDRPE